METKSNVNPYSKIFGLTVFKSSTGGAKNQLLGFTVFYDAEVNRMSMDELLDKITGLLPSPHSIFQDKEGYLLRFELDNPFDIEVAEQENELRERILNFLEKDGVVRGKFQEMEIGKWETHLVLLDGCEVRECL
jgi:hypothetical protein